MDIPIGQQIALVYVKTTDSDVHSVKIDSRPHKKLIKSD